MLGPDRWRLIDAHLSAALDLDDAERAAWLAALRGENAALAAEVEALLDEHRELAGNRFLEGFTPPLLRPAGLAGQIVGAYTLVSPIGHGGMGAVWLAERSDGRFDRRVAVKFLNIALVGRGEERFKREGTLVARLTHPHIAQLLDAGVADGGQPFLTFELVDGAPIDRYCEQHQLGIDARIRLFLDVLGAVAHAHANLIVHRDIKPSTVFVDRTGHVKLLDFGIAKLLEADDRTDAALLTRGSDSPLTPEYAAPEQMTGGPVTTSTDVYALGLLLYVVLAGRHPAGALNSPADVVKAVTETEAPRMSVVAPDGVRRQLRGDLDVIVAKALAKNPAHRYVSVTDLADDLTRYLHHQPIRARRETVRYRAAKFVRRNRLSVAIEATTLVALLIGLYVANVERVRSERRFEQLRQLSNKVVQLDQTIKSLPGSVQARQSLVAASLEYLEGLAADGGNDIGLSQEIGEAYWRIGDIQGVPTELNLGDFAKAEDSLKKADTFIERVYQARPTNRTVLLDSAEIAGDRMILAQSEHRDADAIAHARKAADRIDRLMNGSSLSTRERDAINGLDANIALAYANMHLYADATRYARQTVEISRPYSTLRLSFGLSLLANLLRYQGDVDGAVRAIDEACTIARAGPYKDETQRMIDLYAVLLRDGMILGEERGINAGRPEEAIDVFQEALDLTEGTARQDANDYSSRDRTATAAWRLGDILLSRDPRRALAVYDLGLQRLSEIRNNVRARRNQARLLAHSSYALRALSQNAEAKRRIERAMALLQQTKDYPASTVVIDSDVYDVMRAAADDLVADGRIADAVRAYADLLEKMAPSATDATTDLQYAPARSEFYQAFAALYRRDGQPMKADDMESRRLDIWRTWDRKLPGNTYIARQLAAIGPS